MKLSIVIVNYNVKYFLSNCLQTVFKAIEGIDAEVFVVDNNSTDQSVDMVRKDFHEVILIDNQDNAGFSKANNQAIKIAKGEYILLLNPDTVVEEDCFLKCIKYMDEHEDVGGMGVKMIDGSGRFLPESKRGLPTPSVAFFKIFGLSKLFPKSKTFGGYHLGYLEEEAISEVEVLSGAYMLMRKTVIDQIGGLDEAFFMYGEDIDMSYRIVESGHKNVYFPPARIIHFKGESTKKSTVNYVLVFYRAMIIFARKHFSSKNARLFSFLINSAIYFRAFIALINQFLAKIYMPVFDIGMFWGSLVILKAAYEDLILKQSDYYPQAIEFLAFPILISCWVIGQLLLGGYHQPVKFKSIFKGLITGALLVFILYALLDESLRFSRAIVLMMVFMSFIILPLSRIVLNRLKLFKLIRFTEINSAIFGSPEEIERVKQILSESPEKKKNLFFVSPWTKSETPAHSINYPYIGSSYQLSEIVKVYDIDELIFCLKDVSSHDLIDFMQTKAARKSSIFLHPSEGDYLLRSSSTNSLGEFILPESNPIMPIWSKRKKRLFEVVFCSLALVTSPLSIFIYRKPWRFIKNMLRTIFGSISLVGGDEISGNKSFLINAFPVEKKAQDINKLKVDYLMNYGTEKDLELVLSQINRLDKKPITI